MFCSFGQLRVKHQTSVPRLFSGFYQLFDLCLINHVLTDWPLISTLACLVTKQCLMVFGRQTFPVCPGPRGITSYTHKSLYRFKILIGEICQGELNFFVLSR